ncbi:MAG: UTP--glucose-1-phosphate uridylyltransferase [Planctomycetota bacterium]|jgi:UDP-N-acetylglucosamine/UDP-N-acetylgalactosamine diphosphorylase
MTDRLERVREQLVAHGQEHVLTFFDTLSPQEQDGLLLQIEQLELDELDELVESHVRRPAGGELPTDLEPAPYYGCDAADSPVEYDPDEARRAGEELIRSGAVAAFTVAGGQGTRLGWKGPKGTYPATVVTGKPLFRCFAEQILAAHRKYGVTIPWYIMTSPLNDASTRSFFADNNCFGLDRTSIFMFPQGVMPSLEMETGRLLLAAPGCLAVNPDGHGGALRALRVSGAVEALQAQGIEHLSYFQVDNPLAKVIDPLFVGLHATARDSSAEMSSKMVAKTDPAEKVGVFCRSAGKTVVIEYSDLPGELAESRDDAGRLRFNAGSIAIHLIGVSFIERLTADLHHSALPYHRAVKKVPHVDLGSGRLVEPEAPNAVKLETFIFDALRLADSSIVLETDRVEEFAPIKNASGVDSPETSHRLQSERAGRWLERRGVAVPRDGEGHVSARIEISPLTALEPDDLEGAEIPGSISAGEELVL